MSDVKEKVEMELKPFESVCDKLLETLKELTMGNTEATPEDVLAISKSLGEVVDVKKDIVEMCYKKQIMEAMEENEDSFGEEWDENGPMYYTGQPRSKTSGRFMRRGDGRRNYPSTVVYYTDGGANRGQNGGQDYSNGNMDGGQIRNDGKMNNMRSFYQPESMYRMDMDLYRMDPEQLYDEVYPKMRRKNVHYYTDNGMRGMDMMEGDRSMRDVANKESRIDRAIRRYTENKDMQSLDEMMTEIEREIKEQSGNMDATQKNMAKTKLTNLVNSLR